MKRQAATPALWTPRKRAFCPPLLQATAAPVGGEGAAAPAQQAAGAAAWAGASPAALTATIATQHRAFRPPALARPPTPTSAAPAASGGAAGAAGVPAAAKSVGPRCTASPATTGPARTAAPSASGPLKTTKATSSRPHAAAAHANSPARKPPASAAAAKGPVPRPKATKAGVVAPLQPAAQFPNPRPPSQPQPQKQADQQGQQQSTAEGAAERQQEHGAAQPMAAEQQQEQVREPEHVPVPPASGADTASKSGMQSGACEPCAAAAGPQVGSLQRAPPAAAADEATPEPPRRAALHLSPSPAPSRCPDLSASAASPCEPVGEPKLTGQGVNLGALLKRTSVANGARPVQPPASVLADPAPPKQGGNAQPRQQRAGAVASATGGAAAYDATLSAGVTIRTLPSVLPPPAPPNLAPAAPPPLTQLLSSIQRLRVHTGPPGAIPRLVGAAAARRLKAVLRPAAAPRPRPPASARRASKHTATTVPLGAGLARELQRARQGVMRNLRRPVHHTVPVPLAAPMPVPVPLAPGLAGAAERGTLAAQRAAETAGGSGGGEGGEGGPGAGATSTGGCAPSAQSAPSRVAPTGGERQHKASAPQLARDSTSGVSPPLQQQPAHQHARHHDEHESAAEDELAWFAGLSMSFLQELA